MIIFRYLFKEIFRTQVVILIILLGVFLSQSLIRLVSRAAVGSVPVELIASLATFAVPEIAMILLPLTLFLAVLISLGRISSDSEMVVLRSVGYSPANVMTVTMVLALLTGALTAWNSLYLVPEASRAQHELKTDAQNNPRFLPVEGGRFITLGNRFTVYVEEVNKEQESLKSVERIYVMDSPFDPKLGSLTIARSGYLQTDADGISWLYLNDGTRYEGSVESGAFRRAHFDKFQAPLTREVTSQEDSSIDSTSTWDLLHSDNRAWQVEAQWRISTVLAVFVLTLIAVPLSMVNPRQGRFAKLMPAILIYASYYMFLLSVRNLVNRGALPLYPGLYLVPLLFVLFVAIPLNLPRQFLAQWWHGRRQRRS